MENKDNWKTQTLILGSLIGAASGLLASYLLIQKSEQSQIKPKITTGEGVKLGMGVLGILKLISDFGGKH